MIDHSEINDSEMKDIEINDPEMKEYSEINDPEIDNSGTKMKLPKEINSGFGTIILQHVWHEFLAMFLFVFFCCGTIALSRGLSVLSIAATFGLCITLLVYLFANTSGGQVNSAVTVALMVSGNINIAQGLCNIMAQIFGAIVGAFLLWCIVPSPPTNLGVNQIPYGTSLLAACIGEFMGTYLLCWVVFQTAVAEKSITRGKSDLNPVAAPIAIGAAVFLAHMLLIPLTSCSINFPRSFGPAIISTIKTRFNGDGGYHFWVYFLMPHLAGACAGAQRILNLHMFPEEEEEEENLTASTDHTHIA